MTVLNPLAPVSTIDIKVALQRPPTASPAVETSTSTHRLTRSS